MLPSMSISFRTTFGHYPFEQFTIHFIPKMDEIPGYVITTNQQAGTFKAQ